VLASFVLALVCGGASFDDVGSLPSPVADSRDESLGRRLTFIRSVAYSASWLEADDHCMTTNAAPASAPARLLVADDDPLMVKLVGDWLRDSGFEVLEAPDATRALEICVAHRPDLAIIDFDMPGFGGAELASRIHSHTDVPVIFLTGRDEPRIIEQAIGAGALAYLIKPVKASQLLASLRTSLERGREMNEMRARANNLSSALESGRLVNMATGLLMGRLGMTQQTAFACLRHHARSNRARLDEIATQLLRVNDDATRLFADVARHAPASR
jgi:response regulator NasT